MPTAMAKPWPSGPVVASTPSSMKFSGWPAQGLPSWRKLRDVLDRRVGVAGEVEQRIDQHRAVAGRQHEAVAVGPVGIGGIVLQIFGEQDGGDVGHAHRHAGMAAELAACDRVHRQRADGVGEQSRIGGHALSLEAAPGTGGEESRRTLRGAPLSAGGAPVNRSLAVCQSAQAMLCTGRWGRTARPGRPSRRIERALARIESAAGAQAAPPPIRPS